VARAAIRDPFEMSLATASVTARQETRFNGASLREKLKAGR